MLDSLSRLDSDKILVVILVRILLKMMNSSWQRIGRLNTLGFDLLLLVQLRGTFENPYQHIPLECFDY